ncbi:hypothetical protein ACKKBG_A01330 [Auxenochlorella protothecoides x Auxenochlorella symbiontica]
MPDLSQILLRPHAQCRTLIVAISLILLVEGALALQISPVQRALAQYLTNEELSTYLQDYQRRCRDIAKLHVIGTSVQGRQLLALELAASPGSTNALPHFRYVGNLHGNEPTGRVLTLALAEYICEARGEDPQVAQILAGMHLWLMPSANPDGFDQRTRENINNVDLNRDFPDRFSKPPSLMPTGSEQAEVRALMDWSRRIGFTASAAMHEGALVANYPMDGTQDRSTQYAASPDDGTFRHLATKYAQAHTRMALPTNKEFPNGGITNGAAWYPIYGSMQDWVYLATGCFELTLEVSESKWPPVASLGALWKENKASLLGLPLLAVLGGVRGVVKASNPLRQGGIDTPLRANVTVAGIETVVQSREGTGVFARPLAPGTYELQARAHGYTTATQQTTVPDDGTGVEVLFELKRVASSGRARRAGGEEAADGAAALDSVAAWGVNPGGALRLEPLRHNVLLVSAGIVLLLVVWFGGWRLAATRRGRGLQPRTVISIPLSRVAAQGP